MVNNTNEMMAFANGLFGSVRAFNVDGKAWFVGKDVAQALGYKEPHKAVSRHCKYDGMKRPVIDSMGRTQEVTLINEYDVIRLTLKSRLPQAERFEAWVVEEVIPQILRTGGYIPVSAEDTEEMIKAKAEEIASKTVAIKDEIIAQQQARIDYLENDVKDADRLIGVLTNDVQYLFNDTDFGVHSISDAYEIVSHSVNGSRKFVKWFNEHNEKVKVIDSYIDDNGSRIKNAIDLSDINIFHDFKDLVFAYQQEQQGFTRSK